MTDQERKEFRETFEYSRPLIERIKLVLQEELQASMNELSKKDKFFMPAWSEYAAYTLGEQEALKKILTILEDK